MMAMGAYNVKTEDGMDIDIGEFVSYPTYVNEWKQDCPNLKVSMPVEDIYNLCYTFAHHTKFLVPGPACCNDDNDNEDNEDNN
jgi:hypothetical protein